MHYYQKLVVYKYSLYINKLLGQNLEFCVLKPADTRTNRRVLRCYLKPHARNDTYRQTDRCTGHCWRWVLAACPMRCTPGENNPWSSLDGRLGASQNKPWCSNRNTNPLPSTRIQPRVPSRSSPILVTALTELSRFMFCINFYHQSRFSCLLDILNVTQTTSYIKIYASTNQKCKSGTFVSISWPKSNFNDRYTSVNKLSLCVCP